METEDADLGMLWSLEMEHKGEAARHWRTGQALHTEPEGLS